MCKICLIEYFGGRISYPLTIGWSLNYLFIFCVSRSIEFFRFFKTMSSNWKVIFPLFVMVTAAFSEELSSKCRNNWSTIRIGQNLWQNGQMLVFCLQNPSKEKHSICWQNSPWTGIFILLMRIGHSKEKDISFNYFPLVLIRTYSIDYWKDKYDFFLNFNWYSL